jgi:hypothetical protein
MYACSTVTSAGSFEDDDEGALLLFVLRFEFAGRIEDEGSLFKIFLLLATAVEAADVNPDRGLLL